VEQVEVEEEEVELMAGFWAAPAVWLQECLLQL
jgi:hypothetical protein